MKKVIAFLLTLSLVLSVFAGCTAQNTEKKEDNKISIVTTIFPIYDWVRELTVNSEDKIEITLLMDSGVDLHNYQPTADDMIKISDCDLFIYVGGESDDWVDDALKNAVNQDMKTMNLLALLGDKAKEEELSEGMESGEEEEEGVAYDEHIWLSLKNAQVICEAITNTLMEINPANKDVYEKAYADYASKLSELDTAYQQTAESATVKTLLFGDRFPFRYMTDDYGLDYYAAFVGCSAETEASFETVSFLASKVDELGLKYVMTIEGSDHSIAQTIINNSQNKSAQILTLNSMQSEMADNATYLSIMQSNLEVLQQALS